ncbi:MAG TPA: alpha/beta hydrolase [Sphingobacteriaceae bacterium]
MTDHYFEHPRVTLHYYKYGTGDKNILCFHGFGMHGKQFALLESTLGSKYTFYGFDLFFHQKTRLKDSTLEHVKAGISKRELANLIEDFCCHENINRFSVIGYSMGTHYATAIVEQLVHRIDEYIVAAPAALNPGMAIRYFSKNRLGNKILEKLAISQKAIPRLLFICRNLGLLDSTNYKIFCKETGTPELRFNFYASMTYLRHLDTDMAALKQALQLNHIKSIFIFGTRDRMYPVRIGKKIIPELSQAQTILLEKDHEMIDQDFASSLERSLL